MPATEASPSAPDGGRRAGARWRRWAVGVVLAALIGLAVLVVTSWHFSSRALVPDRSSWSEEVGIEAVFRDRIVLARSEASLRPGYYGLAWESGHAIVGPVLSQGEETVTRRLSDVRGYLVRGLEAGLESHTYAGTPAEARGLPFAPVRIVGELGPMPAWRIPAQRLTTGSPEGGSAEPDGSAWAIVVHGINDNPQVGLRIAPALRQAGLTSLLITYREDLGAPTSPDGLHHLGLTEWRDLEAAAGYALAQGARRLVLVGYSMGGAIVTQFMQRSPLADRVTALVLDAPVLDWKSVFSFNATEMGYPSFAALPVEWAIDARIDVDWDSLDAISHPEDLQLPILLFHSLDDEVVPISTSDELAEEPPDRVTYYRVPKAGHTQSWNVDPRLYEQRLRRFLDEVGISQESQPLRSPRRSQAR